VRKARKSFGKLHIHVSNYELWVLDNRGKCVANYMLNRKADAERLVLCWNCHDDALGLASLVLESHRCGFANLSKGDWQAIVDASLALISHAEGR
jgi:hypothetical protein